MNNIVTIPDTPDARREWIKFQLRIRGLSLAALARKHKAARSTTSRALKTHAPYWENVIAQVLELTPRDLWPERYDRNGLPKPAGSQHAE